jgi:hypothetical protein
MWTWLIKPTLVARRGGSLLSLAVLLAGCGGTEDPFQRADVQGTVTLDGQPLKYGLVYFKAGDPDQSAQVAQALLDIRDGAFISTPANKPAPGANTVTVTAYVGDPPPLPPPDDENDNEVVPEPPEPKVLGYYRTEINLKDGEPVELVISKADLQKMPFE